MRTRSAWLLLAASAVLASCRSNTTICECIGCQPAITLVVSASGGGPPAGLEVVGGGGFTCERGAESTLCTSDEARAGNSSLIVRAQGADDIALVVTVPDDGDSCCECGYIPQVREVVIESGDAGAPNDV